MDTEDWLLHNNSKQVISPDDMAFPDELEDGMTVRTYLAGQALVGLSSLSDVSLVGIANDSVELADLVIKALNGEDIDKQSADTAAKVAANIKSINEGS